MNTHQLPTGQRVDCHDNVALWVWATYFAHAQMGMGLEVVVDLEARTVEVGSVNAPLYGSLWATVNLDTAEVLLDRSEQDPVWPAGLALTGRHKNWLAQARQEAKAEVARHSQPAEAAVRY